MKYDIYIFEVVVIILTLCEDTKTCCLYQIIMYYKNHYSDFVTKAKKLTSFKIHKLPGEN